MLTRLNAYITSQSFLFVAYGISMSNNCPWPWGFILSAVFPTVLCGCGLTFSLGVKPAIDGAIHVIAKWREKGDELVRNNPDLAILTVQRTEESAGKDSIDTIHARSLTFVRAVPNVFLGAWVVLFLLMIVLHGIAYSLSNPAH
jgi:hypothetical protein